MIATIAVSDLLVIVLIGMVIGWGITLGLLKVARKRIDSVWWGDYKLLFPDGKEKPSKNFFNEGRYTAKVGNGFRGICVPFIEGWSHGLKVSVDETPLGFLPCTTSAGHDHGWSYGFGVNVRGKNVEVKIFYVRNSDHLVVSRTHYFQVEEADLKVKNEPLHASST